MEQTGKFKEVFAQLLEERNSLLRENNQLKNRVEEFEKENATQKNTISVKDEMILTLKSQLEYLKRKLWGSSSERQINNNLSYPGLFDDLELTEAERQETEAAIKEIESILAETVKVRVKEKPVRKPLPENLPRREEHHYPAMDNREEYDELPAEITEILEHEPGKCYVRKIIRHKYVRKTPKDDISALIITAPLPALPLPRSYAETTLLSELMINKYVDHLPFYRQIQMFKRDGLTLSASTINGWFKETTDLLRPMYYRLQEIILGSDYIQADETTIPVVIHQEKKAVKGYLWLFRSVMDSLVFFHYDNGSRAQKVVIPILSNYRGALQTDGYDAYSIYENKETIILLACWAHVRRKYVEALTSDKERAEYALSQIRLLYDVERMADTDNLPYEERKELRNRLSKPIIVSFEKWLLRENEKVTPKSPIGKAIKYTLNNYVRLKRYLLNGKYMIDNNLIENSVRPVALGKRNYLFCGNHSAAEDAAVIYSLMGCCKASNVNFRDWFEYVLNNIHSYDSDYSRDLAELLPHNWKIANTTSAPSCAENS
ncbi:MAG: IS66 family transposase [Prevotellaceae bacterium]|jgi:transposase|nr:IS66 family transposase [Prevotellaceae bacterium]